MDEEEKIRIHNHPKLEQSLGLDKDHIIVDREIYDAIVRQQCGKGGRNGNT